MQIYDEDDKHEVFVIIDIWKSGLDLSNLYEIKKVNNVREYDCDYCKTCYKYWKNNLSSIT